MARKKMSLAQKVNILRASVMGANDGIISIAGIVIGVAAATNNAYSNFWTIRDVSRNDLNVYG